MTLSDGTKWSQITVCFGFVFRYGQKLYLLRIVYVCMYVCIYYVYILCMKVCMYVFMYMCVYVYVTRNCIFTSDIFAFFMGLKLGLSLKGKNVD